MLKNRNPNIQFLECKLDAATEENSIEFPKKKKVIELPNNLAIPFMGIYLNKMKTLFQKEVCTPMFISVVYNSQDK